MAIPTKDSLLAEWSTNTDTRLTSSAVDYGCTPAQAAAYTAVHDPFIAALTALQAARAAGVRSSPLAAAKSSAKLALLRYAREVYAFVQANLNVADEKKIELGVKIRDVEPTPEPAPADAPAVTAKKVYGRQVQLSILDASGLRNGRPLGCAGAALYSLVSETPPTSESNWKAEGNITRNSVLVEFPPSVAPGAKVWFTAYWYNRKGQAGPACSAISANIGYEGATPLAA